MTTTRIDRQLSVAEASRDYWAEEYQRAAMALNDRPTYYHRAVEARAWAAYLAAERHVAECRADRDGVCYPPIEWLGQTIIRTDRRHHNRAIQALKEAQP